MEKQCELCDGSGYYQGEPCMGFHVKDEKQELADSLLNMYNQYCQNGHAFMTAGEEASSILERQGYATFDEAGRIIKLLK